MKYIYLLIIGSLFLKIDRVFAAKTLRDASANLGTVAGGAGVQKITVATAAGNIIRGGLTAVGLIFFVLVFYGGLSWMMARGNEEKVTRAKNTVIASILGLVVVLASYAITIFVSGIVGN